MQEVCKICGLPIDLCICKEISREQQRVVVKLEKRKFGKPMTIIDGIQENNAGLRKIAQALKTKCACGGTAKGQRILLQGDQREKAKEFLIEMGFPEANIDVE
jgi:translation initiation factor 1